MANGNGQSQSIEQNAEVQKKEAEQKQAGAQTGGQQQAAEQEQTGRTGDWTDWISTFIAAVIVTVCCIYVVNNPKSTMFIAGLFGAVSGWAAGLVATPYNSKETAAVGNITKVMSGVVSGYLVAKLDRVFDLLVPPAAVVTPAVRAAAPVAPAVAPAAPAAAPVPAAAVPVAPAAIQDLTVATSLMTHLAVLFIMFITIFILTFVTRSYTFETLGYKHWLRRTFGTEASR